MSDDLGEHMGLPQNPWRRRVAMASNPGREGRSSRRAGPPRTEAERLYVGDFSPNVRPIRRDDGAHQIAQGELGKARDWAQERHLSIDDELTYLREFEHITLARLLLARYRHGRDDRSIEDAERLLARLLRAADDGGRFRQRHRGS